MPSLQQSIKELYGGKISDAEAEIATNNLLGFFKILQQIDSRIQAETQIKNHSEGTQKTAQENLKTLNKKRNKSHNEHHGN